MPNIIKYTKEQIWEFLSEIPDPEIPVISIVELGVLRNVELSENKVIISITPTYSGCPAMKAFEDDIKSKLLEKNILDFEVLTIHSPACKTYWINDEAKEKLRKFGRISRERENRIFCRRKFDSSSL